MSSPFRNLRALIARIDVHGARVRGATPLQCQAGCSACCYVRLSVSTVEADYIRSSRPVRPKKTGRGAHDANPLFEHSRRSAPCVFLDAVGMCAIYEVRPIICRTHGFPLLVDERRDICPLNRSALDGIPLNLELLNRTLTAIDLHYCRETGQTPRRIPLADLIEPADDV